MFLLPVAAMPNISTSMICIPKEAATTSNISSSETRPCGHFSLSSLLPPLSSPHHQPPQSPPPKPKKKRNQPGNPDPDAEVVALSPKTLMATNRFVCEICSKGFQSDQNLQLHRRGHNLPWKLRQKSGGGAGKEGAGGGGGGGPARKRVYVCQEPSCVHHHPSRALGDLTGIKKHFSRKHGEKKLKCERCAKRYAVPSDWKAHVKACGSREYRCDCGTLFSRKDTFITHRAFCDALAEESKQLTSPPPHRPLLLPSIVTSNNLDIFSALIPPHLSATALLQKASAMGLLSLSSYGYTAPAPATAGGRGDAIRYLHPSCNGAGPGSRSTGGFAELLPDLATGGGASYTPMAGGPTGKRLAGFPPATGTWS